MIRIGIVGIGFMGMIHYLAARKLQGARVEAICSRDEKKLAGDWRSIQGNFGPRGEQMDLSALRTLTTDANRALLLLPGRRVGGQILLYPEVAPETCSRQKEQCRYNDN